MDKMLDQPRIQSLNYGKRKREKSMQIEEKIKLLKKIHLAAPTIKLEEYKKHQKTTEKLK